MNYLLCFSILLLILLIFISRKEGLVTNIDEEIRVPVISKDLITKIQLNTEVLSGDAWINLGDITLRDKAGNQIYYGNTNDVYFGNRREEWSIQNLWDDNKYSGGHSNREAENLIIKLKPVELGSVQITNRQDCCWHRIGNYRLSIYNYKNEEIAFIKLNNLVGQGKTVLYKLSYPQ